MMKKTPLFLLVLLLAAGLSTPADARPGKRAGGPQSAMITEVPSRVKSEWETTQAFIQAWAEGNADALRGLMCGNIEYFGVTGTDGNPVLFEDEERDIVINKILNMKEIWRQYNLLHLWAALNSDAAYLPNRCMFDTGKTEDGQTNYTQLALSFSGGKIVSILIFNGPAHGYTPDFEEELRIQEIKGVHFSAGDTGALAAQVSGVAPSTAEVSSSSAAAQEPVAAPPPPEEIAGVKIDPAGIGTWDGIDKKFNDHKLVKRARQSAIMYNVASEIIAQYAEMRQTGGEENADELIGEEITLMGLNKTISGEQFKQMIAKSYLTWPGDTWPIRASAVGSLIEFLTKIEAPGFEEPIFLKTVLVMDGNRIKAIGEPQCVKMDRDLSGQRLPEVEYESLTKKGRMKAFQRNMFK